MSPLDEAKQHLQHIKDPAELEALAKLKVRLDEFHGRLRAGRPALCPCCNHPIVSMDAFSRHTCERATKWNANLETEDEIRANRH